MNRFFAIFILLVIAADQFFKFAVSRLVGVNESLEVVRNFFYVTLVHNTGAAFGIFRNGTIFFVAISIIAVIGILLYQGKHPGISRVKKIAFALIIAGATGNLIDRLRLGYVIDFLDFRIWPVFNVADSAITIGAALLIANFFKKTLNTKPKNPPARDA